MKIILCFLTFAFCLFTSQAQSFAINTDGSVANASAMLDVKSTNKGLLIPRLTKGQKNTVTSPATGLLIYQTGPDSTGFYFYQNNQWNWIGDAKRNDTLYWGLTGNTNLNPPPGVNNIGINPLTDHFFGTMEAKDLSFVAGSNELLRIHQQFLGGRIGMSNRNPEYSLDIRTTENSPNTSIMGMRIIPNTLFDFNGSDNRDKGLIIGYESLTNREETILWNFGSNTNSAFRIGLSNFSSFVRPALNITGKGLGIYQKTPGYMLDLHSISNFALQVPATGKNGMRITYPGQENNNNEKNGLFMGVDVNAGYSSYIWNYANGINDYSAQSAIYFGLGDDPDIGINKPTMQIRNGMVSVGNITPNTPFPSVLNIQTQLAANATKNGLSIIQHLSNNESAYFGTDLSNNLNIQKFGTGDIWMDINNNLALVIRADGNFKYAPIAGIPIKAEYNVDTFRVSGIIEQSGVTGYVKTNGLLIPTGAGTGKVLTSDLSGNATWSDAQAYWTLTGNDIYNNNSGNTGIGVSDPFYKLDVGGRIRLRADAGTAGIWLNNQANTTSPAFIGMRNDNLVGFYGSSAPNNGWGLLMNTTNGRVGIGTDNPSEALHVIGNVLASGTITPSDIRYKKNIQSITDAINKVMRLNGVIYNLRVDEFPQMGFDSKEQIGLIAQEVEKVLPNVVVTGSNGYRGVDYAKLVPLLIEAIKEQQTQIDLLKNKLDKIKYTP